MRTFIWAIIFAHFSFAASPLVAIPLSVSVQSDAAILMNGHTGAILFEKNGRSPYFPASIIKIATAAYALEVAESQLLTEITATQEALGTLAENVKRKGNYTTPAYYLEPGGTHMNIRVGEEIALKDLLVGLMVASANDAANVIALSLGGTIPNFMEKLNVYLKEIGCHQTYFCNPHGLHHPQHVTTAYDMALLTCRAMKNPLFRKIVATTRCVRPKTNKQKASVLVQTNRLLKSGKCYYPKAIGVKTGHIAAAQNTLVAAAVQGERLLIAVLLKCKERENVFLDAIQLFEAAFNQPKVERLLLKAGETAHQFTPDGATRPVKTWIEESVSIAFYPAEEPEMAATLEWKDVALPIEKGQKVGEITIRTSGNKVLCIVPLLALEDVGATWSHWLRSFFL